MSRPRHLRAALLAGAIALCAMPAHAQLSSAPVVPVGRTLDGTLRRTDPTINERGRFQVFRLDANPGTRYSIVMRADDFDSYLSVARQVNGLTDYVASDDDGAGASNARLRWTPKVAGTYYLVAQSLKADGVGAFTVRLDTMPTVISMPPRPVTPGLAMNGDLTESDPMVDDSGPFFDLYRITARKGQRLQIEMKSQSLDSFVSIGRMNGDTLDVLETDDDNGGEKDARLRYTVKTDGTYIIRAQALDVNATGGYRITVSELEVRPAVIRPLASGVTIRGTLSCEDEEADDGSLYESYRITARAGESVTFVMRSTALDSFLVLGQMIDGEFTTIVADDDGAGGTNARIRHTFEQGGEFVIRANTVGAGKVGAYTIRVDRASASRPAPRSSR